MSPERNSFSSYRRLLDDGEPFRLLFPVAFVIGVVGIGLWPLYVFTPFEAYPGLAHSRIMIQGHMTAFILGFLGTALPRMLEVRGFGAAWAAAWTGFLVLLSLLHLTGNHLVGDGVYLLFMTLFLVSVIRRLRSRADMPPPSFILVGTGLLCGMAGTILQIAIQTVPETLPSVAFPLARLLLNQAFLLLPVMGAGAFFMPRFFGLPNRQAFPESRTPPPGWNRRAAFAAACGLAVLFSFVMEAMGAFRTAFLLRGLSIALFFIVEVPAFRQSGPVGSLATAGRVVLVSIPAGYLLMAVWPLYQTSLAHVVFITGFSLLTFSVAGWVTLGHTGQSRFFKSPIRSIRLLLAFLILAMVTRVTADWMPDIRLTHYAYASMAWLAGAFVWAWRFLPRVQKADEAE